jgi:hypothetical protein
VPGRPRSERYSRPAAANSPAARNLVPGRNRVPPARDQLRRVIVVT